MFFGGTSMYFPSLFIICFDGINNEGVDGLKKKILEDGSHSEWVRVGLGGDLWRGVVFPAKAGSLAYIRGRQV